MIFGQHQYLYFLQDKNYKFYKLVNGSLVLNTQPVPLEFSPDGWRELSIENVRNDLYFGIDRSITIPFKFVRDGAGILKAIRNGGGVNADVQMVIMERRLDYNGTDFGFWYKEIFRADIDLSTYSHAGFQVTANLLEGGFAKYIKANDNTTYEFDLDDAAALAAGNIVYVEMDGIRLHEKLNYQDLDGVEFSGAAVGNQGFTPTAYLNKEGDNVGLDFQTQSLQNVSSLSFPDKISQTNCLLQNFNDFPVDINLVGRTEILGIRQTSPPGGLRRRFLTSSSTIPTQNDYQVFQSNFSVGGTQGSDFNITITLNPGDRLYSEAIFAATSGNPAVEFTENSKFSILSITRRSTTYVKGFRPGYLFSELIRRITDGKYKTDVSGLLTTWSNIIFTSGDGIRGVDGTKVKLSLRKFFSFWLTFQRAGIGANVAGLITMQRQPDMVDYGVRTQLGEVSSPVVTVPADKIFNSIKIGYPDTQVEGVNGKQAFCNTFEFSIPDALRAPKVLDITTDVIADCYSSELVRAEFLDKTTTNSNQDNEVYVLDVETVLQPPIQSIPGYYKLDRSLNPTATGLIEPDTVFNLRLSVKRCLLNNGSFIRSCCDKMDTSYIVFQSAPKNADMACGGIAEKSNVLIGELDTPYFQMHYLDFETPKDVFIPDELAADPLRVMEFTIEGEVYTGLPVKLLSEPSTRATQVQRVLVGIGSDMERLNTYYG